MKNDTRHLSTSLEAGKFFAIMILSFILSGCVVRTYPVVKDRVDQELSGNRGYLSGDAPAEDKERKATRTTTAVEIELRSPIKFEKLPAQPKEVKQKPRKPMEYTEDREVWGNRGFITKSVSPKIAEPSEAFGMERYTVQKGDTLQKISRKFYGTTRKWNKIYDANSDTLKGPDKIYPGQVINVPVEEMKEPVENLK